MLTFLEVKVVKACFKDTEGTSESFPAASKLIIT